MESADVDADETGDVTAFPLKVEGANADADAITARMDAKVFMVNLINLDKVQKIMTTDRDSFVRFVLC